MQNSIVKKLTNDEVVKLNDDWRVITWRELGFNCCHMRKDYAQYESLPVWAQNTLKDHEKDTRTARYGLEELEGARTHAAQIYHAALRATTRLRRKGKFTKKRIMKVLLDEFNRR